jgi:hypothetical protein
MTTLTFKVLAEYQVIPDGYQQRNAFIVKQCIGTDRDELPEYLYSVEQETQDDWMLYERFVGEYWTRNEAESAARRLCMEKRSAIPGAFCIVDHSWPLGEDDAVYVNWDQACEDGR